MKIGSLCTGYGGLDMAVEAYFDAQTVWVSEIDKHASNVIAQRFGVTNHGDLKAINWAEVEPIDILTAGYPCQPFSHAGHRKGLDDERHIWPFIKEAISNLRPRFVILENVRGHLSLGFDQVLKDLTEIGYDTKWQIVRASDIGAPHQRARLFIVAYPNDNGLNARIKPRLEEEITRITGDGSIANTDSNSCSESRRNDSCFHGTPSEIINGSNRKKHRFSREMDRQEVPATLDQGKLNAKFVEYMMGLPTGWVTDTGLSRAQQLKMLGNGVVPQQAYYALELLATRP
jgi:DNA (cytosine-5)-methyltransferase 1